MVRPPSSAAAAVVLVAVALLASACSGDDEPRDPGAPPTSSAFAPSGDASSTTTTTIGKVTGGRLSPRARAHLSDEITATVDQWFEAAFLGGDYPRTDFDDAYGAFTEQARARAVEDRALMSNAAVGETTYAVRARARRITIDVLTDRGRAAAVTAHVRLGLARAGESGAEREERIRGRLLLTHQAGDGWRIFGYDLERGVV